MPDPRIFEHVPMRKLGRVLIDAWATIPEPTQVIVTPEGNDLYTVTIIFGAP